MKKIDEYANENVPIVLVGTKADLVNEREVTKDEGEQKAFENEITFFELSARENAQVDECFSYLLSYACNYKNGK